MDIYNISCEFGLNVPHNKLHQCACYKWGGRCRIRGNGAERCLFCESRKFTAWDMAVEAVKLSWHRISTWARGCR